MATKAGIRPDEGLMMMQELDDRLKEQNDKLEHVRLAAIELKDNLSGVNYTSNKSLSIGATVWSKLLFLELSSDLTLFFSNTEQRWSEPVYRWPSGVVESLVRESGDSSHEHNCFRPGEKRMWFLMGSWLYFYLWLFLGTHQGGVQCFCLFSHFHFICFQMNPKPRAWAGRQGSKHGYRLGRLHQTDDAQSEFGWSPIRTRRNSDAASEMSCNWWPAGPLANRSAEIAS